MGVQFHMGNFAQAHYKSIYEVRGVWLLTVKLTFDSLPFDKKWAVTAAEEHIERNPFPIDESELFPVLKYNSQGVRFSCAVDLGYWSITMCFPIIPFLKM